MINVTSNMRFDGYKVNPMASPLVAIDDYFDAAFCSNAPSGWTQEAGGGVSRPPFGDADEVIISPAGMTISFSTATATWLNNDVVAAPTAALLEERVRGKLTELLMDTSGPLGALLVGCARLFARLFHGAGDTDETDAAEGSNGPAAQHALNEAAATLARARARCLSLVLEVLPPLRQPAALGAAAAAVDDALHNAGCATTLEPLARSAAGRDDEVFARRVASLSGAAQLAQHLGLPAELCREEEEEEEQEEQEEEATAAAERVEAASGPIVATPTTAGQQMSAPRSHPRRAARAGPLALLAPAIRAASRIQCEASPRRKLEAFVQAMHLASASVQARSIETSCGAKGGRGGLAAEVVTVTAATASSSPSSSPSGLCADDLIPVMAFVLVGTRHLRLPSDVLLIECVLSEEEELLRGELGYALATLHASTRLVLATRRPKGGSRRTHRPQPGTQSRSVHAAGTAAIGLGGDGLSTGQDAGAALEAVTEASQAASDGTSARRALQWPTIENGGDVAASSDAEVPTRTTSEPGGDGSHPTANAPSTHQPCGPEGDSARGAHRASATAAAAASPSASPFASAPQSGARPLSCRAESPNAAMRRRRKQRLEGSPTAATARLAELEVAEEAPVADFLPDRHELGRQEARTPPPLSVRSPSPRPPLAPTARWAQARVAGEARPKPPVVSQSAALPDTPLGDPSSTDRHATLTCTARDSIRSSASPQSLTSRMAAGELSPAGAARRRRKQRVATCPAELPVDCPLVR